MDSFSGAYQSRTLPYDVIRVLAGFGAEELSYRLLRDFVDPPKDLEKLIFPWVEDSITLIQDLLKRREIHSEHSGLGFLKLLLLLRRVFLQDAAAFYLNSDFSKYEVFQLPLFKTAEFVGFQKKLTDGVADPSIQMLYKAGTETKLNQVIETQAVQESIQEKRFKRLNEKMDEVLATIGFFAFLTKIRGRQ